jgi:hypothetical protein
VLSFQAAVAQRSHNRFRHFEMSSSCMQIAGECEGEGEGEGE